MRKKEITQAVLDANRANAKKSTGPRTYAGKLKASRNALTDGFFARELVLNDEEKRQVETIRRTLHPQLAPETFLQILKFAETTACICRCKLALRLEMRHIRRVLGQDAEQARSDPLEASPARQEWYLTSKQGLREGASFLEAVKQDFLNLGRIEERWNAPLDQAFGPQFRQLLTQWLPPSEDRALLAHHLVENARITGRPLPSSEKEQGSGAKGGDKLKVILDPIQQKQMVMKLFELEGLILSDLWRSSEQRASILAGAQNDGVDYSPRYFSAACRDLDRAIDRFMYLKKNNL